MVGIIHRLAIIGAAALAPLAFVTVVSPGVSNATECGWGTVFDPPSNTCVAAPLPAATATTATAAASVER